ncbi:PREDICTED: peptidyl-prolyl cis-trans isomerase CYP26-2, chloroplastic [Fragaria vesca subsp. vesca]|uniref:peptidyl-prolyl cis-trans isomerase CYP26-2, chloroplastic n=1 Tax=Fragaria vesca subsp. vesca TaxID=101020 RepID=UPI0002C35899|nr:PREDICTED: peptidyl-prolyl cis-trans isomerase CYP26-2, chloroplastic [Fragaria vesca subsp. vesca]
MLQIPKFLQSSTQCLHPPTPQSPPPVIQVPGVPTSSFRSIKQCCKLSRRELAIRSNSLLLLLLGSQSIEVFLPSEAEAEEDVVDGSIDAQEQTSNVVDGSGIVERSSNAQEDGSNVVDGSSNAQEGSTNVVDSSSNAQEQSSNATPTCGDKTPTKRAFLDISIDGEPIGRIVIGLQEDEAPFGAARFRNLVSGAAGVSYRRKEFIKITPSYVQHGGVRSYGVDAELAKSTGSSLAVDKLIEERESLYEKCPGIKNKAGTVGIIVRDPSKPPPKTKLVARKGKLEFDQEEVGTAPNGTEFVISTKDSPELDASALVVGRVLEGMEVVERLGQVKTVQENTSSPYFRVAKLIGDKRAVVAERGFNRPYAKVVVTNCGLMQ